MNGIEDKDLARILSLGRMAIGTFLFVAPGKAARAWVGEPATPGMKLVMRSVGARDFVLGMGTAVALEEDGDVTRWLEACAIADVSDAVSTLTQFRRIPRLKAMLWLATASTAAFVGLQLAANLED